MRNLIIGIILLFLGIILLFIDTNFDLLDMLSGFLIGMGAGLLLGNLKHLKQKSLN